MNKYFILILVAGISLQISAQTIAQWRGDNRDGIYNETGLLKKWPEGGPHLLWHFDELGDGHSSAAVYGSTIYTAGTIDKKGFIYALDFTGKLLWKTEYGDEWTENWSGTRSTPVIDQNKLYILSAFGKLVCMDAKNGQTLWTIDVLKDYDGKNITFGITENLLIDQNTLYCTPGGDEANMIALDKNTGKLIWKSKGDGEKSAYCSPSIIRYGNKNILVTMTENNILGVDASNGNFLWKYEHKGIFTIHPNTPLYYDGKIYCVSGYAKWGVMLSLSADGNSISEFWKDTLLDCRMGGVVRINDHIYGLGDKHRKLFCLNWQTGKIEYSASFLAPGNLIADDGLLYCYCEDGTVGLVESQVNEFDLISSFKVPFGANQHWAHLVIHDKKLFVRHGTSLMVYDISDHN